MDKLNKWKEFAVGFEDFIDKLIDYKYDDEALLLLDPKDEGHWNSFVSDLSLVGGDRLKFQKKIMEFKEMESKITTINKDDKDIAVKKKG